MSASWFFKDIDHIFKLFKIRLDGSRGLFGTCQNNNNNKTMSHAFSLISFSKANHVKTDFGILFKCELFGGCNAEIMGLGDP